MLNRLLLIAIFCAYFTIVLGAATRVYDAGMACPDWPLCYGQLLPFPAPEGGYISIGISYSLTQVLLEWGHRLIALITSLLTLVATIISATKLTSWRRLLAFAPLVLILIQIKLGGLTVFKENIHWSVALHLGMAMLFFGALVTLRRLVMTSAKDKPEPAPWYIKGWLWLTAFFVWVTMVIGGMVSASHSGAACGGLFACNGIWWPDGFHEMFHMKHRYLALLTTLTIVALYILVKRVSPRLKKMAVGLKVLLAGQIILGVLTLYSFGYYAEFYQVLSVLHLAWGTLLWLAAVGALNLVYLGSAGSFHDRKRRR